MEEEKITEDLYRCFNLIRSTVEGIIPYNNGENIWNIPGSLKRAKKASFEILTNGLRKDSETADSSDDMIKHLCVKLIPSSGNTSLEEFNSSEEMLLDWLEKHLLENSILECIKNLFLETWSEKILSSYKEYAYVKSEDLLQAYIACLDALQQSSMNAFTLIKPSLLNRSTFIEELKPWVITKILEEIEFEKKKELLEAESCYGLYVQQDDETGFSDDKLSDNKEAIVFHAPELDTHSEHSSTIPSELLMNSALSAAHEINQTDGPDYWYGEGGATQKRTQSNISRISCYSREISRSETSLYQESSSHSTSDTSSLKEIQSDTTLENFPVKTSSFAHHHHNTPRKGHNRSKSDHILGLNSTKDQIDGFDMSLPSTSLPKQLGNLGEISDSGYYRYESGQLVAKPFKGQSLFSYLDSRNYDTGVQLDKENAHFSICEALITAIEEMRCQSFDKMVSRRRKTIDENADSIGSDANFSSGNSSNAKSSTTFASSSDALLTDDNNVSDSAFSTDNRKSIGMSWENVSLSPRKLKKDIEAEKPEIIDIDEIPPNDFSAEAVAKSLLHKFQGQKLPDASELKWIVSELDAPQELLPLPTAWPISPDSYLTEEADRSVQAGMKKMSMPSLLRGNFEWAPPRSQIIFVPHPFVKRKVMLQRQHYRCRGCGLKVSQDLSKRFRYCEYLGKFFCTSCHQRSESVIPAKVLSKWDFKKYLVSDFSRDLLKKIHMDPLFNVHDISPKLYDRVRSLNNTKNLRIQLHYMKTFLETCRYADSCQKELSKLPMHICDDPHIYSVHDLLEVKNGELQKNLSGIISRGDKHIKEECQVCQLKGYICEVCSSDEILYPFELRKVHVCQKCKTCSHRSCYVSGKCKKCERIQARKKLRQAELPESPELL